MSVTKFEISKGTEGLFIKNSRFKTTLVSFNFYLPLEKEKAALFALLPFVMTTCSKDYSDFRKLNFKLSKLYGAELTASAEKTGDYQLLKMSISVIGDKYALDGEVLTAEAIKLLCSLIFEPKIINGAFCESDVEREKRKAIEHIKGEFSEKRIYAKNRLISEMYKNDAYGIPKCGTVEDVEKINGKSLFAAWQEILTKAFVRVNVIADNMPNGLFDDIAERFSAVERNNITDIYNTKKTEEAKEVKIITEKSEVNQGKLVMGFSLDKEFSDPCVADSFVAADIFGGGPYSKLFSNVREKMSLCYYCSARSVRVKGLVTVESGIEAKNAEKTQEAVLEQLKMLKEGNITDDEINSSVLALSDSLNRYNDSSEGLESWYSTRIFDKQLITPEEYSEKVKAVTKDEIIKAANGIKLHTVFLLLPEDEK
ncbi:MAG: insulinase family protein [Clostridia bacterium]|nr:insulinase family protein [Clostridia bacterium]